MDLLIDMDGVLANLEDRMYERLMNEHGAPFVDPNDRVTFYFEDQVGPGFAHLVDQLMAEEHFFATLEPYEGAIEAMELLSAEHNVTICTSPMLTPFCIKEKVDWVTRYLGEDHAHRMIVTRDKTLIRGDVLLDDKPEVRGAMDPVWEHVSYAHAYNVSHGGRRMDWKQYLDGEFKF